MTLIEAAIRPLIDLSSELRIVNYVGLIRKANESSIAVRTRQQETKTVALIVR
jgi:hypothetical protein